VGELTTRSLLVPLLAVVLGLAACSGGDAGAKSGPVALDGTPRVPDVQGVVIKIADDFSTITLDGDRTYDLSPALQSFSTIDGSTQPVRRRLGQYVLAGLDGSTMVWIAGVSAVAKADGGAPVAYYTGNLVEVDAGRAIFEDGTVLTLDAGVGAPPDAVAVVATIDAEHHVVVELTEA
jgi:hypothetical protein